MPRSGSPLRATVAARLITGVHLGDQVHCECYDPACRCAGACKALAIYRWGSVEAGE